MKQPLQPHRLQFSLRTLLLVITAVAVLGLPLAIALFTPPDFRVRGIRSENGAEAILIESNFQVDAIRSIVVRANGVVVIEQRGVFPSLHRVQLPPQVSRGMDVRVQCDLGHDSPMPSVTAVEREVDWN